MSIDAKSADTKSAGNIEDKEDPERRCILTRRLAPKAELIRFVLGPDGKLYPDLSFKLPGRGASVVADRDTIAKAIEKGQLSGALSHALKESVERSQITPALLDELEQGLHRRCADRLGQAQRSGDCVTGFDKIRTALDKGFVAGFLLTANDAGEDGTKKIAALVDAVLPRDRSLSRATLSQALGTDNCVHALIRKGKNADLLITELRRYSGMKAAT